MFIWYDAMTRAVLHLSEPPFTATPPDGQEVIELENALLPGPVEQLRLTADLTALEVDQAKVPAPSPDGPGFTVAMIVALGNDPARETSVARAYPQFFEYIRFGNWTRVQWCITDALAATPPVITQAEYDGIKSAAAAHRIPVTLP